MMRKTIVCIAVILCVCLFSSCFVIELPMRIVDESGKASERQEQIVSTPHTAQVQGKKAVESLHYYNRLNSVEREAYDSMLAKAQKHEKQAVLPMLSEGQISNVFQALCYDNPMLFCLENQFGWGKSGKNTFIEFHYANTVQECSEKAAKMEQAVDEAMQHLRGGMDDFEKELALHDWLAARCEYEESGSSAYTAYGALVNGKAVCEGYSKAMQLLLNRAGISGFLITGQAVTNGVAGGHMWNIVTVNGKNYHLDVTWNVPKGAGRLIQHAYFNLTDEQISADHSGFDEKQSNCTAGKENYFVRMGTLFDSYDALLEKLPDVVADILSDGNNTVEFRFTDNETYETAVRKLFEDGEFYNILEQAFKDVPEYPDVSSIAHMSADAQYAVLCRLG